MVIASLADHNILMAKLHESSVYDYMQKKLWNFRNIQINQTSQAGTDSIQIFSGFLEKHNISGIFIAGLKIDVHNPIY